MVTDDDSSGGGGDSGPIAVGSCVTSFGLAVPCSGPHAGMVTGSQLVAAQCPPHTERSIPILADGVWRVDSDL